MASNYKRIGNYIRQVDVRNTDARFGEEDLYGLSVYKEFIPTHANLVGVKFNGYKIVAPGQFTYIPDTSRRGDKIAIGLNGFGKDIIVSSVYTVFEIYKPDELNAEYLMMLFRNPEYDRFARYNSWGSAREVFSWEDFCDSELYIPDIEEQHKIVRQYKTIADRIGVLEKINEKLEKQAMLIYRDWFVNYGPFGGEKPGDWLTDILGSFTTVKRGGSPRPIEAYISDSGYRWLKISDATDSNSPYIFEIKEHIKESGLKKTVYMNAGELVLSNSATPGLPKILTIDTCIHDGWLYFPEMNIPKEFMYLYFKWERENIVANANGSIFLNLKIDIVQNFEITMPNETDMKKFMSIIRPMFQQILVGANEIYNLKKLKTTILSNVI